MTCLNQRSKQQWEAILRDKSRSSASAGFPGVRGRARSSVGIPRVRGRSTNLRRATFMLRRAGVWERNQDLEQQIRRILQNASKVMRTSRGVHYDMPWRMLAYVHQIGRTGLAGERGYALTLMEASDLRNACALVSCLSETDQDIPSWLISVLGGSRAQRRTVHLRESHLPTREMSTSGSVSDAGKHWVCAECTSTENQRPRM